MALAVLGPQVGLGGAWSLSSRWDGLAGVAYSPELLVGRPGIEGLLIPQGPGVRTPATFVPQEGVRHQLSLQLGVGLRF